MCTVLDTIRNRLHDQVIVEMALSFINYVSEIQEMLVYFLADHAEGWNSIMDVCWCHLKHRDLRQRALTCLRTIRQTAPHLTASLVEAFDKHLVAFNKKVQTNAQELAALGPGSPRAGAKA